VKYQKIVKLIVSEFQENKDRLSLAFGMLEEKLNLSWDMKSKSQFTKNFRKFVSFVRAFMVKK
jgi:hypothetical protein